MSADNFSANAVATSDVVYRKAYGYSDFAGVAAHRARTFQAAVVTARGVSGGANAHAD